ncbi:MAG TPA: DUF6089 family protein [Chitinophagales bacterium]|nr:DUF6089 family protein [Chitinophagales bacterium]
MKKAFFILSLLFFGITFGYAQRYDFGAWLGGATYFGDLNTSTNFQFTNPAGGVFSRINFDDRISFRVNFSSAHVWADDAFSHYYYERTRNLGFGSNIFELSGQFEFNFIPFTNFSTNAYTEKHRYSPFVFVGFGTFLFNPTAHYNGTKVDLQPVGTEGQGFPEYPDLKKYHRTSSAIIFGGGIKWRFKKNIGMQLEGGVRKTSTDYLDDVSGVYADPIILLHEGGEEVAFLSDPSVEVTGEPVGVTGKMRGDNHKSDDYFFFGLGIIYTLKPYKCPFQR